jgi:UPF0042 nucleotide-binding protein
MQSSVRMLVITGLSGAGKTVALQSLEDVGYFCIDNLPPALIPKFAELLRHTREAMTRVAFVCDLRGGEFFGSLFLSLKELDDHGIAYEVLFLEAEDDAIVRRYKASRRRHPLAPARGRIVEGIARERSLLVDVRRKADMVIDTTALRPAQLREALTERLRIDTEQAPFTVNIVSFGFKYGLPIDADLVFDLRFLPNPFYIDELRGHTGQDADVFDYVLSCPASSRFLEMLCAMMEFLIPEFIREGKQQVVVALGCTGGRHRSVAIGEALVTHLQKQHATVIFHRDVLKDTER